MEKKYLIGAGVIALGLFAYSRYAKKDDSGQGEESGGGGGGGGIGGGGFGGAFVNPITNQPTTPSAPLTPAKVGVTPTKVTNTTILKNLGANVPTAATTSSTGAGAQSGVGTNTGITGIGTSGTKPSTTSTSVGSGSGVIASVGSTMTGTAGGNVFKPFSGCEPNGRRPIFLNDLVRSWNRP